MLEYKNTDGVWPKEFSQVLLVNWRMQFSDIVILKVGVKVMVLLYFCLEMNLMKTGEISDTHTRKDQGENIII